MRPLRTCMYFLPLVVGLWHGTEGWAQTSTIPSPAFDSLKNTLVSLSNQAIEENSAEEAQVWGALKTWLEANQQSYGQVPFSDPLVGHSFSRMYKVSWGDPSLIFFFPVNGPEGALNALAGAHLVELLRQSPVGVGVEVVFAGAEDPTRPLETLGSSFYLRQLKIPERRALIYLDRTVQEGYALQTIVMGINSPIWMVRGLLDAAFEHRLPLTVREFRPNFFRFFLEGRESPLDVFVQRGLRSVRLSWSGLNTQPLAVYLHNWAARFDRDIPQNWDRHYVMFGQGPGSPILDQRTYILVLVVAIFGVLLSMTVLSDQTKLHVEALARGFWQIGVFFSLVFLANLAAAILAEAFNQSLPAGVDSWRQWPLWFAVWKTALAVFFYLAFFRITQRLPLYRWSVFYQAAALLLYFLFTIITLALNFGFSFFFLWSFLLALLFVVLPWRPVRITVMALIPLWPALALGQALGEEVDYPLLQVFLFDRYAANVLFTLYLLPLLFLFFAYHYVRHQRWDSREPLQVLILLLSCLALILGSSLFLINRTTRPQTEFDLVEEVDGDLGLNRIILSPADSAWSPPEEGWLLAQEGPQERIFERPIPHVLESSVALRSSRQLDRYRYGFRIQASPGVKAVRARLVSSRGRLVPLEANFPFHTGDQGQEMTFLIGRNPPGEFDLEFTLQGVHQARLYLEWIIEPHPRLASLRPPASARTRLLRRFSVEVSS